MRKGQAMNLIDVIKIGLAVILIIIFAQVIISLIRGG